MTKSSACAGCHCFPFPTLSFVSSFPSSEIFVVNSLFIAEESSKKIEPMSLNIQELLRNLIESAHGNWDYTIFWEASLLEHGSLLGFGGGYITIGKDQGKPMNSSSSSPISKAEREHQKRVFRELISSRPDLQGYANVIFEEGLEDTEWFFLVSMARSFGMGSGLLDLAWQRATPIWIAGKENLVTSYCDRAREAFRHGLQTLVFIPSANGVIELGSTALNFQSLDLLNKGMLLLKFIKSWEMGLPVQEGDESESSNSVGNSAIVGSSSFLSVGEMSLGLHLGLGRRPVKPEYESKSSSSSDGNYPAPVVKEKPLFSGKLQLSSDNHSDSTDIRAFIRILNHGRG